MTKHLHKGSKPYTVLGEELISMPDTYTDVEDDLYIQVPPVNSVTDSPNMPVEYARKGTPDHHTDLSNSEIHIQVRVVNIDGSKTDDKENVTPINMFPHAMFNQIDVYVNEELVTKNNSLYAYRAYISTVLSYGFEAKQSWLERELYYGDTHGEPFDSYDVNLPKNTGLFVRNELSNGSKIIDMIFKPHTDLFMQSRPIPPNTDIRISMSRSLPQFCLMGSGDKTYNVQIVQATLYLRLLKLNDPIIIFHQEVLNRGALMMYPMRRVQMQSFTIGASTMSHTRPNVVNGQLPRRIIMGITTNKAFVGSYDKNPFRFRAFHLRKANLVVNGRCVPSRPYTPNFCPLSKNGMQFIRCFSAATTLGGVTYGNKGCNITRNQYADGYTLIPFTITPDYHENTFGLLREGSVQLELEFSQGTPEVLNVILYLEYENTMSIGKNNDVKIDY